MIANGPGRHGPRGAGDGRAEVDGMAYGRWSAFRAEELRAVTDALRWRSSQLRTLLALVDALPPAEWDGAVAAVDVGDARQQLAVMERLLAELA
jgi:hypothetical protein